MKTMAVHLSGPFIEQVKLFAKIEDRSIPKQIEHWAKLGKCAEENSDLPLSLIKEMLVSIGELESGKGSEYQFED